MKKTLNFVWMGIITLISAIFIMPDRFIQAFLPWRDVPSWTEINEFEHEKQALGRRWTYYIAIFVVISSFWWIPFLYRLIALFF